jgi:hypothetical protein
MQIIVEEHLVAAMARTDPRDDHATILPGKPRFRSAWPLRR